MVEAMGQVIIHRGPDDWGAFDGPGVALGNRRLSIIDVAGGHQPFVSDDGLIALVQNGEIFNYVELAAELARDGFPCTTHSDTEVLLRLYERDGIEFVHKLNGMFAIAVFDGRTDTLHLVRDRVGVKPLFVWEDSERVLFASEIKALLRAAIPREIDAESLHYYLQLNYVPPDRTLFAGVRHVTPGHILTVTRNGSCSASWWDLGRLAQEERSEAAWIEELNVLLSDAVRLRLRSDVPFGAFLSGGIDSSTVVGLMSGAMENPVRTYNIGFDHAVYDEAPFAQIAAERFGTRHLSRRVEVDLLKLWPLATYYCDQPHGDASFMPTYCVSQLAAADVKVVLTGDGGDELFAGYEKYQEFFARPEAAASEAAFRSAYLSFTGLFGDGDLSALYTGGAARAVRGINVAAIAGPLFERCKHMDRVNQALFLDTLLLLPGNNLVKPDRMGMAVSLEVRTPFLDYRVIELAFRMPGPLKLAAGETKYILKQAVKPLIGRDLAYRRKQMFTVPIGDWLRIEPLRSFSSGLLLSPRATSRGLFEPAEVRRLLEAHVLGTANHTRQIRALMAVELWHRIFLDRSELGPPGEHFVGSD